MGKGEITVPGHVRGARGFIVHKTREVYRKPRLYGERLSSIRVIGLSFSVFNVLMMRQT